MAKNAFGVCTVCHNISILVAFTRQFLLPASVAKLDARQTENQEVACSPPPRWATFFGGV